ncbi:MAG: thiamine phosphate synthase [Cyclobacteriaceae bacterium]
MNPFSIIVISPEEDIPNELDILNQLFEAGLSYYHFRKPKKSYQEHADYLNQIEANFHKNIVTHLHHELINEFDLKGIHFQEQKRRDELEEGKTMSDYLNSLSIFKTGFTKSSSFHSPEDLVDCTTDFDYHLLSPVFASISKKGYEGKGFDANHISKRTIGMGGVTPQNLDQFKQLGFDGVGVLGGIWQKENPVKEYLEMSN